MEFLIRYLSGYLLLKVSGEQIERFMNLCKSREIILRNIDIQEDNSIECLISIKDFRLLKPVKRKTHVKIQIMKKHGMPFFFLHHKKRKAFFLGLACMLCVLWVLSGRVWVISVQGNIRNTTPEILKFLENEGLYHGMKTKQVDCSEIISRLRENYEDITWAAAKITGSTISINVKEGVLIEEVHEEGNAANLIADKKGTIVKMVTRSGVPMKKTGDTCEIGDVLVEGRVEILNDSKEVIRYDYVTADADVYIKYKIPYYKEIPMEYTEVNETGKIRKGLGLSINNFYLEIHHMPEKENWYQLKDFRKIQITESFTLPLIIVETESKEYERVRKSYTNEEAESLALKELHKFEENLIQKGVQIFVNNVTIKFSQKICVSHGYLEVVEKIGNLEPVLTQEQPIRKDIEE